jgi:subtilisin family serine protease
VVSAPATDLIGARPGGYWKVQGTSFAAPMVAGTAALVRSRWPTMPAGEVVNRIIRTAKDLGATGRDSTYGFGLIDPTRALTADVPAVFDNPLDTSPAPGIARFGAAPVSGQAQSAPDDAVGNVKRPPALADAGGGGAPAIKAADPIRHGRWVAAILLLLSAVAALLTVRRFSNAA